jgi:hypothetical protein
MDVSLYLKVLGRHKRLVFAGFALATVLAIFSVARPTSSGLAYRAPATYQSQTTLFVTQNGFPWGRSVTPQVDNGVAQTAPAKGPQFADPTRYSNLAILYSHLANSDLVRQQVKSDTKGIDGKYVAAPVPSDDGNGFIPFINLTATAHSAADARDLASQSAASLQKYIAGEQQANNISDDERIQVSLVGAPTKAVVVAGHKPTKPALVFILVMGMVIGLAFLLENMRKQREEREKVVVPAKKPAPKSRRRAGARLEGVRRTG